MKKVLSIILSTTLAIGGASVAFASTGTKTIQAAYNNIKIFVDGKQVTTNAEPFTYNGTTYLPVRAVSQALGKEVSWDAATKTVYIGQKPTSTTTTPATSTNSEKQVYNSNGLKIVYTGMDTDKYGVITAKFRVENSSSKNWTVQARDVSMNGTMISPIMSTSTQAGKNAIAKMTFTKASLSELGISSASQVSNLEFKFYIFNSDNMSENLKTGTIKVNN